MAIRSDSFGSVAEVTAYTRHLLDGESGYSVTTRPTLTEVEKFIDRASALVNACISAAGFTPATVYANSTAKLALDDWVVTKAARMVELTQRGTGYSEAEGSRLAGFDGMMKDACAYVQGLTAGWKELGITVNQPSSEGLTFTALDKHSQRSDPDDTSREQPRIRRRQFDYDSRSGDYDDETS